MQHCDFVVIVYMISSVVVLLVFILALRYARKRHEIGIIQKFLDEYGYDDIDSKEAAKDIRKALNRSQKPGMSFEEFNIIADQVTNVYLDPAKVK